MVIAGKNEQSAKYLEDKVEDRVSLGSPGWPGTQYVDQAGLKLDRTPSAGITGVWTVYS